MRNANEWELHHLAQALTRAKRLEKHREEFHEELYESILYPTVHYDKEYTGNMGSPAVDTQAIRIIELKDRYDKKVQKEYEKHFRWKDLLAWAGPRDSIILVRYFQKKKRVKPEVILGLLDRLEDRIAHGELMLGMERDEQAAKEFKVYREFTRSFRKPTRVADARQKYLIGGETFLMTPEEFATNQKRRKDDEHFKQWKLDNNYPAYANH